jgi:hypothetical protein
LRLGFSGGRAAGLYLNYAVKPEAGPLDELRKMPSGTAVFLIVFG